MLSKADIIRGELKGKRVLDLGGAGYGEDNPYETELRDAWGCVASRLIIDQSENADIRIDFNEFPVPDLPGTHEFDVAVAFDVLEHIDRPVDALRWIPCASLLVSLPNALSFLARRMEGRNTQHIFSFTTHTATNLLRQGGWEVRRCEYTFGKWSLLARAINVVGSLCPSRVATGIMLHCARATTQKGDDS